MCVQIQGVTQIADSAKNSEFWKMCRARGWALFLTLPKFARTRWQANFCEIHAFGESDRLDKSRQISEMAVFSICRIAAHLANCPGLDNFRRGAPFANFSKTRCLKRKPNICEAGAHHAPQASRSTP